MKKKAPPRKTAPKKAAITKPKPKPQPAAAKPVAERTHTNFFGDVHDVARQIPKGRVTSYGAIAAYLGTRLSARMVGWAMNGAHWAKPRIPAHRVVNRNGMLSGRLRFETPTRMQELLEKEGVKVKNDTVVDFEKLFWDPVIELAL